MNARSVVAGIALVGAVALLTFELAVLFASVTAYPGPFVDWRTYVNAAARLLDGAPIYADAQLSGPYRLTDMLLVGYAYPPASVPLFVLFRGYPIGLTAWITLNLGLLLTALWAIISRAWPHHRVLVFAVAIAGLGAYLPFLAGMIAMSVNIGIAGLIGWVAVGLTPRPAGLIGGLFGVVKVFPGAIALATPSGKTKSVAVAAVCGGLLIAGTLPLVGVTAWYDFVRALIGATPDCSEFNVSVACLTAPTVGLTAGSILGIAIGVAAVIGMVFVRSPFVLAVLTAIVVMAPASNLHIHYWTVVYVLAVAAAARLPEMRHRGGQRSSWPPRSDHL